ncbi:MAG: glycosyltransferase, partial [Acidimicrobiales bacterium]
MADLTGEPQIAVLVIGRNEGDRLIQCLRSVLGTNYPHRALEVVYVDSDSNDGSVQAALDLGVKVVEVSPERPCAAVGRNAGWRAVDADLILFLDGDTVLDPDFLTQAVGSFDENDVAVVFGHRREMDTVGSIYNRTLDLDWVFPLGEVRFCGGDALMRRDVLALVDGFDEGLIAGEEPDLCRRMREIGYKIMHIDLAMTLHDLDMHHFSQYWKRGVRTGHAYAEVAQRFRGTDDAL